MPSSNTLLITLRLQRQLVSLELLNARPAPAWAACTAVPTAPAEGADRTPRRADLTSRPRVVAS